MEEVQSKLEVNPPQNTVQSTEAATPLESPNSTLEKLKLLGVVIAIFAFTLYATQSWKGDAGFPGAADYDFPFHAYRMWFTADHLQHLNFFFDWDYKSNTLFSRTYPMLPYVIGAPLVMLAGLWQGISYYVILCYFILGLGMYALGRTLKLSQATSLFMGLAMLMSYGLLLESNYAGGLHRLLAYALLPWLLVCFFNRIKPLFLLGFSLLLAGIFMSHATTGISALLILAVLWISEIISNFNLEKLKKQTPLIIAIALAALLTVPYAGTTLIEQTSGAANTPLYLKGSSLNEFFGYGASVPAAFVHRQFGAYSNDKRNVSGYMGITIIALAAIGLALNRSSFSIALLATAAFFYLTLIASNFLPPLLQAVHYSRMIFLISFPLTILAAFGVEKILENSTKIIHSKWLVKATALAIITLILFVDLSPGFNAFPNSGYNQESIKEVFSSVDPAHRGIVSNPYLGYIWTPYSPAEFIQQSQEVVNPEYFTFTYYLYKNHTLFEKVFSLLDVGTDIRLDIENHKLTIVNFDVSRSFNPSSVILINFENLTESETVFERISVQPWYDPIKIGFILPRGGITENSVDYTLVNQKTGKLNEITLEELPALFSATLPGTALGGSRQSTGDIRVNVDRPGWVFVSQMWYPHWRVNGKPLQEAGGGLIAFYADKPGEYKIYWERPWYDYFFWTIRLATLALLGYLFFNPKKYEDWLAKLSNF